MCLVTSSQPARSGLCKRSPLRPTVPPGEKSPDNQGSWLERMAWGPGRLPSALPSTSGSGVASVLEVTLKPNRQGHCLPVPWSFGATFSLGKVPVFIYKNRISLNGAICFKCLLNWRLPHLTVGVIKGTGSPF